MVRSSADLDWATLEDDDNDSDSDEGQPTGKEEPKTVGTENPTKNFKSPGK